MNLPKAWDAKLGAGSFFAFYKPIQEVWVSISKSNDSPVLEQWIWDESIFKKWNWLIWADGQNKGWVFLAVSVSKYIHILLYSQLHIFFLKEFISHLVSLVRRKNITIFPHIFSTETILFCKSKGHSTEGQRSQYIKVRKLFKGGNYSRAETIWGNTIPNKVGN